MSQFDWHAITKKKKKKKKGNKKRGKKSDLVFGQYINAHKFGAK